MAILESKFSFLELLIIALIALEVGPHITIDHLISLVDVGTSR